MVKANSMAGPYLAPQMHNSNESPIGVVLKADGEWCMITHLPYPPPASINDHKDPQFTSVSNTSFDTVVQNITTFDQGALIAIVDIKNVFHTLPIYLIDFELYGIYINEAYYIYKCHLLGT